MKTLSVVLSASLVANGVLGMVLFFCDIGGKGSAVEAGSGAALSAAADAASASKGRTHADGGLQRADGDRRPDTAERMRDRMRALGVPEECIRKALASHLMAPYQQCLREHLELTRNRKGRAYWQGDPLPNLQSYVVPPEKQQELLEHLRVARQELRRLLGPAPIDPAVAYLNRRDYLNPDKYERLTALEADYLDLRNQTMNAVRGIATSEDEKRLAFLEAERERDLAALLTPEELEAHRLRNSKAATMLRARAQYFDATEGEYRLLYGIFDGIESRSPMPNELSLYAGASSAFASSASSERTAAYAAMNREIEQALGPQRYADYLKAQQPDYQVLQVAAQRFDLPSAVVEQVYGLREKAVQASQAILEDRTLTSDARKRALADIAANTRAQVRQSAGADVGDAYLRQSMSWLSYLDRGLALKTLPLGAIVPANAVPSSRNAPAAGSSASPPPNPPGGPPASGGGKS